jgi:hypothetical protein
VTGIVTENVSEFLIVTATVPEISTLTVIVTVTWIEAYKLPAHPRGSGLMLTKEIFFLHLLSLCFFLDLLGPFQFVCLCL